ncbi:MAG: prephenate dehydrogenase/arogenate dehydrogenase family protein [Armatimonadota bacterium]|nr:prephenate dehydrogenase/arogenate dehydrogenase family protein [Armatimonadota bacterium]MDR7484743.1 prephenate dehydrogenase/arogenate dehydrogenase family protein [Armatimonadota bacterium]MDR7531858.1 prephenate dehydrogenase/arogenate dehydrogenase family protein [Armatimonadota bacterium]MDR7534797.1 prephenate dehydrogenase/arogenate dehydrogenase family protein [Armatimonadota bacterium]
MAGGVEVAGVEAPGSFPRTAAVVGLGLIGGSLALRLRACGVAVIGIDTDPATLAAARARGAADLFTDAVAAAGDADLVIVAVPLEQIVPVARAAARAMRRGAVLTDAGSVKARIVAALSRDLPAGVHFVGGHPMAGSERRGIAGADPALLDGRPFVLTPTAGTAPEAVDLLRGVIIRLGMRPVLLDPIQHDELVAQVSHLPYLVSVALDRAAADDARVVAGPAYADMTRIARSPAALWAAVCRDNREAILRALARFEAELARLRRALEGDAVHEVLPADEEVRARP